MKLSDYIVRFLESKGVRHVFGYPGGMITHLMDSLSTSDSIKTHLAFHEQAAAFETVAYIKATNQPAVAFTSSGPGATNLITGICDAWLDSVPAIFITGNVNTYESRGVVPVRQKGFQELDIISMVKSITKYAYYLDDPRDVKYVFEKAFALAEDGRKGPCLIDIPMDITRAEISENELKPYVLTKEKPDIEFIRNSARRIREAISNAKRPVLIAGNGIHISHLEDEFFALVQNWKIPVVTSLPAYDLLSRCTSFGQGFIGAYGMRAANIILERSDLVISLGSRLDNRQTGNDVDWFATGAHLIRIDVDENELKLQVKPDEEKIQCCLKDIIPVLLEENDIISDHSDWLEKCKTIRNKLSHYDKTEQLNCLHSILQGLPDNIYITTDVGQNQIWVPQAMPTEKVTRTIFSAGLGSMGFSLPASIGVCLATDKSVYCFTGDGGLQMNIQELQFIVRDNLPIKIIVLNNHSLGMIRHFQELYFDEKYFLTTQNSGYDAPSFPDVAAAYKIPSMKVSLDETDRAIEFLNSNRYCLLEIDAGYKTYLEPKSLYNKPLAYQLPAIPAKLQEELMTL